LSVYARGEIRTFMALIIDVKVLPRAHKQDIQLHDHFLKCSLISAAEAGRANKELIALLAERSRLPKSAFVIISGMTTRMKRIKIMTSLTKEMFFKIVGG
jgi:uncharacterized protein (TIGR00251 family)